MSLLFFSLSLSLYLYCVYVCLLLCRSIVIDFDLPTLCSEHPIEIVLPKHTHTYTLTKDHQQYYNNQRERELEPSLYVYMCLSVLPFFSCVIHLALRKRYRYRNCRRNTYVVPSKIRS